MRDKQLKITSFMNREKRLKNKRRIRRLVTCLKALKRKLNWLNS